MIKSGPEPDEHGAAAEHYTLHWGLYKPRYD